MLDLAPAADEVTRLLDGVREENLADPTPCEDCSVATLLDHLMALSMAFTWGANKQGVPSDADESPPGRASAEHLHPDWRTLLPQRLGGLAQAWADPAAMEGTTTVGGVTMPAAVTAVVALDELVMHGWDLARATDQAFRCDPASARTVLAFTTDLAKPEQAAIRGGIFGPIVDVPEDAPDLDRALGLGGRDPGWQRPRA
jgi:uncharacterized protein (TIGR03086 family)